MNRYIIAAIIVVIMNMSALAQEELKPDLPTREECEVCAKKKGENQIEKYGSTENYLACLVVGGHSALMYSSSNLIKTAKQLKEKSLKKDIDPREKYLLLRQVRAYAILAWQTAFYAIKFPYKKADDKRVLNEYFNKRMIEAGGLRIRVNAEIETLNKNYPELKKAMGEAIKKTKVKCGESYLNVVYRRIKYPENMFLKNDYYRKLVMPCAEVGVNFYSTLPGPYKKIDNK